MILRSLSLGLLAGLALATSALAQNHDQIARVRGGASCPNCNLFQADLTGLERAELNLSGARLRQANLTLAVMNRVRLNNADLRDINAYGAVLGGADLSGADLTNASLVGVWFQNANWRGAKLEGANLSGSDLSGARGLTQSQLDQACGDASTVLPAHLTLRAC